MTTWRDTASEQAEGDLDRLVMVSRAMGEDALKLDDFIYPFGVGLTVDGEIKRLEGDPQERLVRRALSALMAEAVQSAGAMRAVAFCHGALMDDGGSGLHVNLMHCEGPACCVKWPSVSGRLQNGIEDQSVWVTSTQRSIWP